MNIFFSMFNLIVVTSCLLAQKARSYFFKSYENVDEGNDCLYFLESRGECVKGMCFASSLSH